MEGPRVECEEVDVIFHARVKNAAGQTVEVRPTPPVKLLRANVPDIWAFIDAEIARQASK